ncbi:ubiquitin-specific protease doa4 [Linderina macrospora]|uniref:Ubiquitin-specific protease doa4 n=1 Tax=Linderina macrospora TaxID=4868 RepID=A0ACC1JFW3_9FUNG|nr:ubiquitin-specific protease doa4 [Linderina macrospora]
MRSGCSSKDIEKSLVLVSEEQQDWFRRRDEFDIVVYMDQSSRNSNEKGLRELVAAIYHYEVEKTLRHSPLLLIGGMDGWEKEVGVDKCLWSSEAASMKHNNAAAPNIASMLSYHTPTGSLSNARQFQTYEGERQQQQQQHQHQHQHQQYAPVPDLYRYQPQMYQSQPQPLLQQQMLQQPQASVGSVGSVYDFFQQNSNYRRQWQTEGYMQTSNVSYTPGYNNVQTVVPQAMMVYPSGVAGAGRMGGAGQVMTAASAVTAEQPGVVKPLPEIPGAASRVQRRKTVFDNPVYGFTGSTAGEETSQQQAPLPPAVSTAVPPVPQIPTVHQARIEVSQDAQPAQIPSIPPKPAAYQQQQEQEQQKEEERPQEEELQARPAAPAVIKRRRTPPAAPLPALPPGGAAARKFYANPVAAGSDPSLNGRMHTGGVIRSQAGVALDQGSAGKKAVEDAGGYGSTGLKNFGNTCFMNCIIQCLAGTTPFVRYFRQGHWKRDMVGARGRDVAVEFARLVDTMWSGQYGSLSPIAFRKAVGCQSEQFKGNEQEDAQEFAVFLLDALHEALNTINPRPPADKELSAEDERVFERLVDARQAQFSWDRYVRRNWSIVTSIFQGQAQSRLTCLTCHHTSTTYATFTELSVPVPAGSNSKTPIDIYRCLAAYAEIETLDGDDRWKCPNCKAKRRATKRLLISRLPLVLIVHLKRFSTIGHFREKLETHVAFPTRHLQVGAYAVDGVEGSTAYNLYAVANHFGTLSGGHYTASVFNGLRQNWNYYDDTRVSTIKEADVATPAAYLLFYVRAQ